MPEEIEFDEKHENYEKTPVQRAIHRYVIENKGGCVLGITGRVNTGKSCYGVKIIRKFNPKLKVEDFLVYEVKDIFNKTFSYMKFNGSSMTQEDFDKIENISEWCKKNINEIDTRPGKALLIDEAGASIACRDFFTKENRNISKLIQIWRFMRMVTIFVVPERFELMEKTIRGFMDLKIIMHCIDRRKGYAVATAYERCGVDIKGEPIFRRLNGNKYRGGKIIVFPPSAEDMDKYEHLSKIFKATLIMELRRDLMGGFMPGEKAGNRRRKYDIQKMSKEIWDGETTFKRVNKKSGEMMWNVELIQATFGYPKPAIMQALALLDSKQDTGIDPS